MSEARLQGLRRRPGISRLRGRGGRGAGAPVRVGGTLSRGGGAGDAASPVRSPSSGGAAGVGGGPRSAGAPTGTRRGAPPSGAAGASPAPEELLVREVGRALFEALLPGEAAVRYAVSRQLARDRGRGLRLRLRLEAPAVAALPWELLYDAERGEHLCLSRRTPVVRHLDAPQPTEALPVAPPLRVLGLVASPPGLPALDAARERRWVEAALAPLRAAGRVELVWAEGQTWRALQGALRRGPWHVFHFVGHGGFDPPPARPVRGRGTWPWPPRTAPGRTAWAPTRWGACWATWTSCAWRCSTPARGPGAAGGTSSPAPRPRWRARGCWRWWRCSTRSATGGRWSSPAPSTTRSPAGSPRTRPWARRARR